MTAPPMTTTPQNLASKVLSRNTATIAATAIAILADAPEAAAQDRQHRAERRG